MCFRRKKAYQKSNESHELHAKNVANCEALLVYASEDEETKKAIEEVLQLLKYKVGPSAASEAKKIDIKIANKIDDIKVMLSKIKDDTYVKVRAELKNIEVLIAERQVYSK